MAVKITAAGVTAIDKRLAEMAARVRDLGPAMVSGAKLIDRVIQDTFRAQRAPTGEAWKPLALSTQQSRLRRRNGRLARRGGFAAVAWAASQKALKDTSRLMGSSHASAGGPRSIVFGTDTPYAGVHQFGTSNAGRKRNVVIPARPFLPVERFGGGYTIPERGPIGEALTKIRKLITSYIRTGRPSLGG